MEVGTLPEASSDGPTYRPMSLLDDILAWATDELTVWQRDAVRRLFQKQDFDQQDYDELYARC